MGCKSLKLNRWINFTTFSKKETCKMWCTQGLLRPILISVVIFMALMFTYSRNNECPTCVYICSSGFSQHKPHSNTWTCFMEMFTICCSIHLYLSRVRSAVLWSCGHAVMRSCSLAVMRSCSHARVMPKRSESNPHVGSVVEVYWVSCFNKPVFWTMFCRHKYKIKNRGAKYT